MFKQVFKCNLETTFIWIPLVLGVSRSVITPGGAAVWSLHITPFIAIGIITPYKQTENNNG